MDKLFAYRAVDASGKVVKGEVQAKSQEEAMVKLKALKYTPISVEDKGKSLDGMANKEILPQKVTNRDVMIFCKQLGVMLGAGVPINTALELLIEQIENTTLRRAVNSMLTDIQKGESLSRTMRKFPKCFPPLLMRMIEAGEMSGRLDDVLARMAVHYEKEVAINRKVKKATSYPIILLVVTTIALAIIMIVVVPIFSAMYEEAGSEMPKITQIVIKVSNFMGSYWYIVLIFFIALYFGLKSYINTPAGRHWFDSLKLKMPAVKKPMAMIITARFTRTFATLSASGVPLVEAVRSSAGTTNNVIVEEAIESLTENIRKGASLSSQFPKIPFFPKMMTSMISIGEESGSLDEMLNKTADFYDGELDAAVDTLIGLMEPIAIVVMGGLIGAIVASVFIPIFGVANTIK